VDRLEYDVNCLGFAVSCQTKKNPQRKKKQNRTNKTQLFFFHSIICAGEVSLLENATTGYDSDS